MAYRAWFQERCANLPDDKEVTELCAETIRTSLSVPREAGLRFGTEILGAVHWYMYSSQQTKIDFSPSLLWSVVKERHGTELVDEMLKRAHDIANNTPSLYDRIQVNWPEGAYGVVDDPYHRGEPACGRK